MEWQPGKIVDAIPCEKCGCLTPEELGPLCAYCELAASEAKTKAASGKNDLVKK